MDILRKTLSLSFFDLLRTCKEIRFCFWAERGQGWQGSETQAYWWVSRVLMTLPAVAAAVQKWKIIFLQVPKPGGFPSGLLFDVNSTVLEFLHTYIPAYLYTCILTYLHTYILTYLHTCILAYLRSYVLIKSPLLSDLTT